MASTRPPRNPELEGIVIEALRTTAVDSPARREAWEVYADWLLSHGEPVGEWLAASLRADAGGEVAAPVQARLGTIERATRFRLVDLELADLSEVPELERIFDFTWERGFITEARVRAHEFRAWDSELLGHTPDRFLAVVLGSPSASMLHALTLYGPVFGAVGARFGSLAELVAASREPLALRSLKMISVDDPFEAQALASMPALDRLELAGVEAELLEPLVSATLRRIVLLTSASSPAAVTSLAASRLAALERLSLVFDGAADRRSVEGRELGDLDGLWTGSFAPRLRVLELGVPPRAPALVAGLARSPLLDRLECLRIGSVDDDAARELLEHGERLRAVAKLELRSRGLAPALAAALAEAGFRVQPQ